MERKSIPEKESFSASSEPSKTPGAANDIPETGTNETTILGAASTSLNEMPSTEKDLNGTLNQLSQIEKNAQISKRQCQIWNPQIKFFSQTSSHLVALPQMRQCCFIQAFLTTKRSWHPPGDNRENVTYWLSGDNEIPSEHYMSPPQLAVK